MLDVELILDEGVGRGKSIRLQATQVVIRQGNGTPICVAADYGGRGQSVLSCVGDADFNRWLHELGVNMTVTCSSIQLPAAPPGARLAAKPH